MTTAIIVSIVSFQRKKPPRGLGYLHRLIIQSVIVIPAFSAASLIASLSSAKMRILRIAPLVGAFCFAPGGLPIVFTCASSQRKKPPKGLYLLGCQSVVQSARYSSSASRSASLRVPENSESLPSPSSSTLWDMYDVHVPDFSSIHRQ